MIPNLLAELRRRLDVPATAVPDDVLTHMLDVATVGIVPWLDPDRPTPDPNQAAVDEATVQLAVKLYDTAPRGVVDPYGEVMPGLSATPGLVRSVFGALGPALHTGGLSV